MYDFEGEIADSEQENNDSDLENNDFEEENNDSDQEIDDSEQKISLRPPASSSSLLSPSFLLAIILLVLGVIL